ncbi:L-Ala-D/L-Glu epimerase [Actinomyces bovis]|uniref:o-succinylbenzoate synthase n=1 Tax=Actinomyces bovis TaxID=1658 RepID=A0ABY1VMM1_9ACTO|nr:o-succinylbenzoate synthase [Actinomyces bovis]SPT53240.1 L-Ala-D/L-Glu epimerase [Actinomyces bovis]VEG52495.1 L-Ala-D/L-Glu epimerase [Actinomyces israelii]
MTQGKTGKHAYVPSGAGAPGELDLDLLRAQDRSGLLEGIDRALVYDIPLRTHFRGLTRRDGVLLHGPAGWGEVAPFWDYGATASAPWLASALEQATGRSCQDASPLPEALRHAILVNLTVPEVSAAAAHTLVQKSGCTTVKVKIAGTPENLKADLARLEAVRAALGPGGAVRIDVNGAWDLESARTSLPLMNDAAGGLEYVEQPCRATADLARLRRETNVPIAADESIRLAADPMEVIRQEAADIAILKVAPLGGVRAALRLAEQLGLPVVVSSALDTSVGLYAGLRLATALPRLEHACGLGTISLLRQDVAVPGMTPKDGILALRRLRVSRNLLPAVMADVELTARWQTRLGHMLDALRTRLAGAA